MLSYQKVKFNGLETVSPHQRRHPAQNTNTRDLLVVLVATEHFSTPHGVHNTAHLFSLTVINENHPFVVVTHNF